MDIFKNRKQAGKELAKKLEIYKNTDAVVIALLRGGIVVAAEVAKTLNLALDFVVLRKVGVPENPELAIGVITEDGVEFFDEQIIASEGADSDYIAQKKIEEKKEIERRVNLYRADKVKMNLKGKVAIIVDDGIATGATMRAAIQSVKKRGAKKIIIAAPVCPTDSLVSLRSAVDDIVCVNPTSFLIAVGAFYEDFAQVDDDEVLSIIKR